MRGLQRLTNLVDLYQFLGGGWIEHSGDPAASGGCPGGLRLDAAGGACGRGVGSGGIRRRGCGACFGFEAHAG